VNEALRTLVKRFECAWPGARINLDSFPSGAAYLDVIKDGRHFLLRYFPDRGEYGIDEVLPGEGFLEKYALITTDLIEATDFLRNLVDTVPSGENGAMSSRSPVDSATS
jgi:hypothetical protein